MGENRELPEGWRRAKFIEFCKLQRGYDLPLKTIAMGSYPVVTSSGVHGYHNEHKANGPCLITGRSGGVGNIHYLDVEKYWPHNTVLFVKDFCGNYPKYVYYYFLQFNFRGFSASTTIPTLDRKQLYNEIVCLPPLPEQRAIVARIEELFSSLDKGIENLKTAQRQLKVYRQAVLKSAFEGKLTNKNVVAGELPKGWKWVTLKELVHTVSDGPFGSNLKTSDYVDNGVRVIRLENIGYMEFRNEFQSFVTRDKYETIRKHTVSRGDIILSSFVSDNVRAAILPDFIDMAINKADCFLVRPSEDRVRSKYVFFYFSTREMYQQLIGEIHGATRPRINTTQLKACLIPLAPLPEQHAIVAEIESRLSVCDKIEENITQSLQQAESLRQSILKKAFEGRLVPQDPSDEPASVLLERIKAERGKSKTESPRPRQARKKKTTS